MLNQKNNKIRKGKQGLQNDNGHGYVKGKKGKNTRIDHWNFENRNYEEHKVTERYGT